MDERRCVPKSEWHWLCRLFGHKYTMNWSAAGLGYFWHVCWRCGFWPPAASGAAAQPSEQV